MPDYVRVRQPETGHEVSMVASKAEVAGLTPLDKPATKSDGTPLPPKYHKSLSSLPSKKPAAKRASTTGRKAKKKEGA